MPPPDDHDDRNESWVRLVVMAFIVGIVVGVAAMGFLVSIAAPGR